MDLTGIKKTAFSLTHSAYEWLKSKLKQIVKAFKEPSDAMRCFYILTIVAICCFAYTWLNNGFTVPLSGDYSLQEMTFLFNGYDDWHYFFRTGVFPAWDRSVFLGMDNVGGNSFYYLFDPFFLILLPFPRDWLLVLQGLEFVPKMVLAGMFFYWFLGEFRISNLNRTIGALAFAFSGYSMCYIWFHFISSVAFLPLCFLGIERIIKERDPRHFLVGIFLVAMTSYFFFVVYMFGLFFYAMFRYFQTINKRHYDENMSVLGTGILSFIVAVMLGMFVLLPGMVTATSMPRVTESSYLETLFSSSSLKELLKNVFVFSSDKSHNQLTPFLNFLFMSDDCYYSNLLNVNYYDNLAGSLYATTPLLLIFFVGLFDSIRRKKISHIIAVILVSFLCLTPFGFYLFSGFTVPYARFFIIPIFFMILYDVLTIQRRREIPRYYLDLSFFVVSIFYVCACYLIIYEVDQTPSRFDGTQWDLKMILIILNAIWLAICYGVMRPFFHKRQFSIPMLILMSIDVICMCNVTIYNHGLSSISKNKDYSIETKIVELLKEGEGGEDYYRIYNTTATRNNSNVPLREGYSGLSDFHSVYPFEAQDFLDRSRIPHGYHNWSMGIYNRRMNLETFLGTKYYLVNRVEDNFTTNSIPKAYPYRTDDNGYTVYASDYDIPYGYKNILSLTEEEKELYDVNYSQEFLDFLRSDKCTKSVYLNTNFIDLGFAFDTVIDTAWLSSSGTDDDTFIWNLYEDVSEYPLLRYAMLDHEDFLSFKEKNKYNAGKINHYGDNYPDTLIAVDGYNVRQEATLFQRSISATNIDYIPYDENADYINDSSLKKPSVPIQVYSSSASASRRMKTTVYAANWPATAETPSGSYATCNPDDYYDQGCLEDYKKTHPWEYANGIRPADTVYDYDSLKDENGNISDDYNRKVLYNSKIVLTAYDGRGNQTLFCPDANPTKPETACYLSIFDTDDIEWRLFDENDNLISFAKHSQDGRKYKQAHGYYTDRPIKTILGIIKTGNKSNPVNLRKPYLYIQRCSDYQRAIDSLKEKAIHIEKRNEVEVNFTTNYTQDQFIVLNYPISKGFKVEEKVINGDGSITYEEVKLYKAQGGFLSFEGKEGERSYRLVYESPYFKLGCMATALGLFITLLCLGFFGYRRRRIEQEKRLRLDVIIREETDPFERSN